MKFKRGFTRKLNSLVIAIGALIFILSFQNCAPNSFQVKIPKNLELTSESLNSETDTPNNESERIPRENPPENTGPIESTTGKTFYVSASGDDSDKGTLSQPFKTIQKGLDVARAGDTVIVRAGVYAGNVTFRYSGEKGRPITLKNYPGERAIIDQGQAYLEANYALPFDKKIIKRVTIISGSGSDSLIGWIVIEGLEINRGYDGIKLINAHDIVIRGCNIHHSQSQGILGFGLRVTIDRNTIANNGDARARSRPEDTNQLHGIYLSGSNHKITNNIIHSNLGFGIQVAGYNPTGEEYYSTEYGGAKGWLIANNTFAFQKNRGALIIWQRYAQNNSIINNIFYENATEITGSQGVDFYGAGPNNILKNNLFYSSRGLKAITDNTDGAFNKDDLGTNLMQMNPLFVNPSQLNFRLSSESPARNRGLNLYNMGLIHDFATGLRPQTGLFDIGAYNY